MYPPHLKSITLPVPEIIAIAVFGWGCDEHPILGKRRPYRVRDDTVRKNVSDFL